MRVTSEEVYPPTVYVDRERKNGKERKKLSITLANRFLSFFPVFLFLIKIKKSGKWFFSQKTSLR